TGPEARRDARLALDVDAPLSGPDRKTACCRGYERLRWTGTNGDRPGSGAGRPLATRRGTDMAMRVDAYTSWGMASGLLARPGRLRDVLEPGGKLPLERVAWQPIDDLTPQASGSVT